MARTDHPYSRVYWEASTDEKFREVWDDDRALATWLRLLVAADQAWPGAPMLYAGAHAKSVEVLVRARLIKLEGPRRYRVVGLDRERAARRAQAVDAVNARLDRRTPTGEGGDDDGMTPGDTSEPSPVGTRDGTPVGTPDGTDRVPRRGEERRGKESRGEERDERAGGSGYAEEPDAADVLYRLTAKAPRPAAIAWVDRLVRDYGDEAVGKALAAAHREDSDPSTLLSRAEGKLFERKRSGERRERSKVDAAVEARRAAERAEEEERRKRLEAMTPEQRARNMTRLRDAIASTGLLSPGEAASALPDPKG